MKKTILIPLLILFSAVSYAQTKNKKDTAAKSAPNIAPVKSADSVKVSADELKTFIAFIRNFVNHSSNITAAELNGDLNVKGDIGVNGNISAFYNKYFPAKPLKNK